MLNLPMDHIGLHCSDVELNAKWYQEELGFSIQKEKIHLQSQ